MISKGLECDIKNTLVFYLMKSWIWSKMLTMLKWNLTKVYLVTIYKTFLWPLLDYGDTIYCQPKNKSFCENLESVQYKATLAITGDVQGISRKNIYQELRPESLKSGRWFRRLSRGSTKLSSKTDKTLEQGKMMHQDTTIVEIVSSNLFSPLL